MTDATTRLTRAGGQLVFSIRGTEISIDITRDLLITDLRIGIDGYASPQVIPLYRYFKQLNTVGGAAVSYTNAELANLEAVFDDQFPDNTPPSSTAWATLRASLLADKGIEAGQGAGQALIGLSQTVNVAGHSLGGHLALMMDRMFSSKVDQIVTLNAPGFYGADAILNRFSPAWNSGRILRIEAAGDGVSEIGSSFPGTRMLVGQENEAGLGAAFSSNHSSVNGADGLVVAEVFGRLDARIATDARLFRPMLDAASNQQAMSYELVLDGLRKLLLGIGVSPTTPNIGTTPSSRKSLYDNMDVLAKAAAFTGLAGKVRIDPTAGADLAPKARNDFGALASLLTLSPFVLTATDAANQSLLDTALQGAWGSTYSDWQTDKAMSQADRDAGRQIYTDTYLNDRQAMLQWVMVQNLKNEGSSVIIKNQPVSTNYTDIATGRTALLGTVNLNQRVQVVFGDAGNNTIDGFGKSDRLYGGAGNDEIRGGHGHAPCRAETSTPYSEGWARTRPPGTVRVPLMASVRRRRVIKVREDREALVRGSGSGSGSQSTNDRCFAEAA